MATTIVFRNLTTHPRAIPQNGYKDMLVANPLATAANVLTDAVTPIERPFLLAGVPMRFWSERVVSQVTIAGAVSFTLRAGGDVGFTGRLRAYLSKITVGGSNVETPIGQADASADLTTVNTGFTFAFTPASAVTIAPNERFICRVTVMPVAGSFGTGKATVFYNSGAVGGTSSVTFTETVTFRANGVKFYFQPSSSGIGNFFNMTETLDGGVPVDALVNTTAGGTDIQWTQTAGGTVLEWISERMKAPGWTVESMAFFGATSADAPQVGALESNAAANASWRMKLFRRQPSGAELLVATWTYTVVELATILTLYRMLSAQCTSALAQVTNFAEDDRLVMRAYCVPFTGLTMGGGFTCTLRYNKQTAGIGFAFFGILDSPEFKASGDPDKVEGPVPDGLPMSGVGN